MKIGKGLLGSRFHTPPFFLYPTLINVKFVQPSKAPPPILVTLFGIVIDVKLVH